jgi:uncharacterized repeat protein (TIGR03803 family)
MIALRLRTLTLSLVCLCLLGTTKVRADLITLYTFPGNNSQGADPVGGVIRDSAGNLYGTTSSEGGNLDFGTVFKLSPSGSLTTLHTFGFGEAGDSPQAGLIMDSSGNLYGTTAQGFQDSGSVFKLSPSGAITYLHKFAGHEGAFPTAGLIMDHSGNLYGTTQDGGAYGVGTVFKLSSSGVLTTLTSFSPINAFTGLNRDGAYPFGGLVMDSNGNLYGTTDNGGAFGVPPNPSLGQAGTGFGTIFKISPDGTFTNLHNFTGTDGAFSQAGLIRDSSGNLYGTTASGGTHGFGSVFELSPSGTLTTLYSFPFAGPGDSPVAGLVRDSNGNLFGTAEGNAAGNTQGSVYELRPDGTFTTLAVFRGPNGADPRAGLILDSSGDLFGTTSSGGPNGGHGTVFEITGSQAPAPEPASLALMGIGVVGLVGFAWRRRRRAPAGGRKNRTSSK